jgi:uncharacterized protein
MYKIPLQITLFFLFSLSVLSCTPGNQGNDSLSQPSGRVLDYTGELHFLVNSDSSKVSIDIALADTPELRNLGLMDVRSLPWNSGMLFIFEQQERLSFWMANTPLPLDLIFVNSNFEIVHIHHNAQPFSQQQIDSMLPALYVVEVNGGFAVRNDIVEGQMIRFEL